MGTEKAYTPEHLRRWTLPSCYVGATWDDYYIFMGTNRDASILTQSNYASGLKAIGGPSDTVIEVEENHWACGWVGWIAIHQDDAKALKLADEVMEGLEQYPVVDEEDYTRWQDEAIYDWWNRCGLRDRIRYCAEWGGDGVSIFAARRVDQIPERVYNRLSDELY